MATSQRILILTGSPGCGKTFTTRTIVAPWKAMGKTIALASPTGRATQRLSERHIADSWSLNHEVLSQINTELVMAPGNKLKRREAICNASADLSGFEREPQGRGKGQGI